MKRRRIGSFEIPREIIDSYPQAVRDAMSGLIVVKAEMHFHTDAIHYTAIGYPFPWVENGMTHHQVMSPKWTREEDGSVSFGGWN